MKSARDTILTVAMKLFSEKGYAGCSIREICQAAGVTKPVLYYHFHSKENLYQELMMEIFGQTQRNLRRLESFRGTLREKLILYVSSELENCRKDPNGVRFLFRMMFSPEGENPSFNYVKEFNHERKAIANSIKDADPGTCRSDPYLVSTALMGMMLIVVLEYLFTGRRTLTRRNAEKLVDLLLSSPESHDNPIPVGKVRGKR